MYFRGGAIRGRRRLVVALLACLALGRADAAPQPPVPAPAGEIRAMWVLRTSLTSPGRIADLVRSAREHGFNTLIVQVRGRGDAYFRGGLEPMPPDLLRQDPAFDPLASVIAAARTAGLGVHAWVNVSLISSAVDLPVARDHLIYRRPDWLMVPREIAQELATVDAESPGFVGKLARWTRAHGNDVEGLYASAIVPESAAHVEAVVSDVARRYPLDGIHLDYARYPNDQFDYSRGAIAEFRRVMQARIGTALRRDLDARQQVDLFAYPDALPADWREFRVARMTALVARLRAAIRRERPSALVSAATMPDPVDAASRRLQDWRGWLDAGLLDAVCPMVYTPDAARFAEQIAAARKAAGTRPVWAGIGAYRLTPARTIENIHTARRLGVSGIVLFSYDSLTNPQQSAPDYLALVSRGAFAAGASNIGSR